MKLYIIRNKETGQVLPRPTDAGGRRGGSRVSPVSPSEETPRVFHNRQAAAIALSHWLRGRRYEEHEVEFDPSRVRGQWVVTPIIATLANEEIEDA